MEEFFKSYDTSHKEERREALIAISNAAAESLNKLSSQSYLFSIRVGDDFVTVNLSKSGGENYFETEFGSDVTFYPTRICKVLGGRVAEMNYGTTGSFSPENLAASFRTRVSCLMLDNWEEVNDIVSLAIKRYKFLRELPITKD